MNLRAGSLRNIDRQRSAVERAAVGIGQRRRGVEDRWR